MSNTLVFKDTIQRLGFTIIEGVKVVQYTCTIDSNNPKDMKIVMSKLNEELYKANRETCRADLALFEDAAYQLQDNLLAKVQPTEEV